jgi:hypothetical protein
MTGGYVSWFHMAFNGSVCTGLPVGARSTGRGSKAETHRGRWVKQCHQPWLGMVYDGLWLCIPPFTYIYIYTTYLVYMVITGEWFMIVFTHISVFKQKESDGPKIFAPGHRLSEVHRRSALMLGWRRWSAAVFLWLSSMVYGRYNKLVNGDYNGSWY